MSDHLELLPAVDVAGGQAVQLVQGVAGSEKRFGDPVEAALRWQEAGAEWIHLVDLDAAFGRGHNRELLAAIVGRLDIQVELSGGIRDDESLGRRDGHRLPPGQHRHRRARAARVVRARRSREWGDRVAVGPRRPRPHAGGPRLDPRGRRPLRGAGPARRRGLRPLRRHRREQGRHAPGPEPPAPARRLRRHRPARSSPAAGSPSWTTSTALLDLVPVGVEGAIIGTALYEGRFTLDGRADARPGATTVTLAVRVIPCLDVDAGRVVKGVNFRDLRDAGDPVELARTVRRRGRRRADLPRHLGLPRGPRDDDGDRLAHRRGGLHPAHRRRGSVRRSTTSTGCCAPAPTRSRSTPPRSTARSWSPRSPTGSATRCWSSRVDARRVAG